MPPTAEIVDVTPDPRTTDAGTVTVTFDEEVTGVNIDDFALTRNGNDVDLTGLTVTEVSAQEYTLDLSGVTTEAGDYLLTLTAQGSEIVDGENNALAADASDEFTVEEADTTPPSVNNIERDVETGVFTVTFSEDVSGVDIDDFALTRDGNDVDLTGLTVTEVSAQEYTLDLSGVTTEAGDYVLTLSADGSGIEDTANNALAADTTEEFTVENQNPAVNFSIDPDKGSEESGTSFTLTATASEAVEGDQTVALDLSGDVDADDFVEDIPAQITIEDGETTGTVVLTVADDDIDEEEETGIFEISDPSPGITLGANTTDEFAIGLRGDFNDDGITNLNDLGLFAAAFGSSEGDVNFNSIFNISRNDDLGLINNNDLGELATFFGEEFLAA
jgi:hypothetical protein